MLTQRSWNCNIFSQQPKAHGSNRIKPSRRADDSLSGAHPNKLQRDDRPAEHKAVLECY